MNAISLLARPAGGMRSIENRITVLPSGMFMGDGYEFMRSARRDERRGGHRLPIAISDTFVADILKPYRPRATYLRSAEITQFSEEALEDSASDVSLVTGAGRFSIPESCYIDDTGHFNAVEFNICYNQLAYVVFAKASKPA